MNARFPLLHAAELGSTFIDNHYGAQVGACCISNAKLRPLVVTNSMTICLPLFEKEQQTGRLDEPCNG